MRNNVVVKDIETVKAESTSHNKGLKTVLINKNEVISNLTQAAVSDLKEGTIIEPHSHETMEEFFYFQEGIAVLSTKGNTYNCKKGTFIKIPQNTNHTLKAITDISFIYWGIAIK